MYAMVVVAIVNLAGHLITIEERAHPWPDLATCQAVLKEWIEVKAADRQFPRRVTKAECERIPG